MKIDMKKVLLVFGISCAAAFLLGYFLKPLTSHAAEPTTETTQEPQEATSTDADNKNLTYEEITALLGELDASQVDLTVLTQGMNDYGHTYTEEEIADILNQYYADVKDEWLSDMDSYEVASSDVMERDFYKKAYTYMGFGLFFMSAKMLLNIFSYFTKRRKDG